MPLSRNLGQYNDVKEVLDYAVANSGGRYIMADRKTAIRWRQRAYMFRKLLREDMEVRRATLGFTVTTPYDDLLITLQDNIAVLTISKMQGRFERLDGTAPADPNAVLESDDELEDIAAKLIKEIGA